MGASWAKNEVTAVKRRCDLIVMKSDGTLAPRGTDFMSLGYVYISGVESPDFALAVGTMTNKRRPLVVSDDVTEGVDTGADTVTLTGHGYETGDGPFVSDEGGPTVIGGNLWIIVDDANTIAFASSLANAYSDTRIGLAGTETGVTISDTADTQRGIDGHFTYEATQAETNHDAPETVVIVDGTNYERSTGWGAFTTVTMISSSTDFGSEVIENGLTRDDLLRLCARSLVANFTKTGNDYVIRDLADSKDSHESTVAPAGKTGSNIIDPT
jgi:hypothetical protein